MHVLLRKLQTAARILNHFGPIRLLRAVCLFVVQGLVVYRKAVVYALDLRDAQNPSSGCEVEFRFLDLSQVDRSVAAQNGIAESDLQSRWKQGSRFFVGLTGGHQCYFSVVSSEGFTVGQRFQVRFTAGREAYVCSCYTTPEYRGRGVYPAALKSLARALFNEGKSTLSLYVETENDQSALGVQKAGFFPVAEARILGLSGMLSRRWRMLPAADRSPSHYIQSWTVTPLGASNPKQLPLKVA